MFARPIRLRFSVSILRCRHVTTDDRACAAGFCLGNALPYLNPLVAGTPTRRGDLGQGTEGGRESGRETGLGIAEYRAPALI